MMKLCDIKTLIHFIKFTLLGICIISCGGNSNTTATTGSSITAEATSTPDDIAASYASYGKIDNGLYEKGKTVFTAKCLACHQLDTKVVGPALRAITQRRTSGWINSMLADPVAWTQSDPVAKQVFEENNKVPMVIPGGTTADERRALIEYLRKEGQ